MDTLPGEEQFCKTAIDKPGLYRRTVISGKRDHNTIRV
jgi:hypothetical protein